MAREAVYQQSDPETSEASLPREQDGSLRPKRMDEMVGQRDVIERLKIAIEAARRVTFGAHLVRRPPGLGKTTFATVIPRK